jgi:hypothetical protein
LLPILFPIPKGHNFEQTTKPSRVQFLGGKMIAIAPVGFCIPHFGIALKKSHLSFFKENGTIWWNYLFEK